MICSVWDLISHLISLPPTSCSPNLSLIWSPDHRLDHVTPSLQHPLYKACYPTIRPKLHETGLLCSPTLLPTETISRCIDSVFCPHTPSTGSQPERGPHACHNHTCVSLYALPLEKLFHPLPKFRSHSIAEFSPLPCELHDPWDPVLFSSHDLMSSGWALWRTGMIFLFIFVPQAPSSTRSDSTFWNSAVFMPHLRRSVTVKSWSVTIVLSTPSFLFFPGTFLMSSVAAPGSSRVSLPYNLNGIVGGK